MTSSAQNNIETLLDPNNQRLVIFPIIYHDLWKTYKKQRAAFWIPDEIDFSKDMIDWNNKLNNDERHFIKNVLAFFAGSDGIVNLNIGLNFKQEVFIPEAQYVYDFQAMMEGIHAETYSLLIDTYIIDESEKTHLFNAIETIPCVKKKANWALKWIYSDKKIASFEKRLIALPMEFERILSKNEEAKEFFTSLTIINQKEYLSWIQGAKKEETKQKRLDETIEKLLAGKQNPSEK